MNEQAPAVCKVEILRAGGGERVLGAPNYCDAAAMRDGRIATCGRVLRLVAGEPGEDPRIEPDVGSPQCAINDSAARLIDRPEVPKDSPYL